MKNFLPIIFLGGAIALFFGVLNPTYQDVKSLTVENQKYSDALANATKLRNVRNELMKKYNTISQDQLDRLDKLLPNNVDNVKLVNDIDSIAHRYGMTIKKIVFAKNTGTTQKAGAITQPILEENGLNSIKLSFIVAASYDNFLAFLKDMEGSLRLSDISSISFKSSKENLNEYNVTIQTYWLDLNSGNVGNTPAANVITPVS
ncbi:MAG: type 4a pilus biogenesis protein PilO [Candidatus Paceibacterota bacterium]